MNEAVEVEGSPANEREGGPTKLDQSLEHFRRAAGSGCASAVTGVQAASNVIAGASLIGSHMLGAGRQVLAERLASLAAPTAASADQIHITNAERLGQLTDGLQRRIRIAGLRHRDVVLVQARKLCESVLRKTALKTQLPEPASECLASVVSLPHAASERCGAKGIYLIYQVFGRHEMDSGSRDASGGCSCVRANREAAGPNGGCSESESQR
jgi:hypothetical protein